MIIRNLPSLSTRILVVSFALQISPVIGTKYTHRAMNGYYCASIYIHNYTSIEHQPCVAHCITDPDCWVLAYNARGKYCLLGTQPCANAVADNDFRMMTFRKHENVQCIQWVWSDGSSYPARTVERLRPRYEALARRPMGQEIYIGRGSVEKVKIYLARNGKAVNYPDFYLLVVSDFCSVAWVSYTVGNPLPRGAVEGGYLSSLGVTYCMRVWVAYGQGLTQALGYYAPVTGLGYYVWLGSKTATQMEILVQVHLFY